MIITTKKLCNSSLSATYIPIFILFFLLINIRGYAELYHNYGTKHSVLFPKEPKAAVLNEFIQVDIIPAYNKEAVDYYAVYHIEYYINSDIDQKLPLFFIASNLKKAPIDIIVNGMKINSQSLLNKEDQMFSNFPYIKPDGNENIYIKDINKTENNFNVKDLIFFNSTLKKGKNYIYLKYKSNLKSNDYGFYRNFNLSYYLFPRKYWKSFGPISIKLKVPTNYNIKYSSLESPNIKNQNNYYFWKLNTIKDKELNITLLPKTSFLSTLLLILKPLGITIILGLFISIIHFYFIKKFRKKKLNYYNIYLIIGNLINPILFYIIYYLSYLVIEWSLGDIALKNYEYIKYPLLFFPLIFIVYNITMWFLDLNLKNSSLSN